MRRMRDLGATEVGDQTVAEGAMVRSAGGRGRRWLWAILSFLFALGVAVSTVMVHSERSRALDSVVERARDEAQLATARLTGRQLSKPVTGSDYDKVAAKIWKSVSSDASIVGVTVWSPHGRILFSLNESLVGTTPAETRSLIMGTAKGSGSTRVLDDTVQTFTPVSKATDRPVAIVEVDQPLALVDAQTGDLWSMVRLGSALGLAVCLLLLGLTFVPSRSLVRAPENEEGPSHDERQEGDEPAETEAEAQQPEGQPPTEGRAPTYEEVFGLQHDLDDGSLPRAPEDEGWPGDEGAETGAEGQQPGEQPPAERRAPTYEEVFGLQHDLDDGSLSRTPEDEGWPGDEGAEMESDGRSSSEQLPAEERAPTSVEDVQPLHADLDEAVQVKSLDADGESQESTGQWPEGFQDMFQDMAREGDSQTQEMRQRREEFKARAEAAAVRVKKLEAEPHEAPPTPD
ncbi:MAG: hypothetical protein WB297_11455 [Actinomycetota bacterium]